MKSNIKIVEKRGKEEGRRLVVLAGVHGNEMCGVRAVNYFLPN